MLVNATRASHCANVRALSPSVGPIANHFGHLTATSIQRVIGGRSQSRLYLLPKQFYLLKLIEENKNRNLKLR